ncbi:MAG: 50S ribosomal protein L9 [Deltaproteobacteria bacterium]|nr:50S ribosomal protein L9 [Deltaproteobacteria bacterium]MCL5791476.1 50S ribosomal protein L9 [Deltaproteobacteria bacterium]
MEVILKTDVSSLGKVGDIIKVKDGYAINYLIPRGIAMKADTSNIRLLKHQKTVVEQIKKKLINTTNDLKASIEQQEIIIEKAIGEQDKLFGAVTTQEIAEALDKNGISIDKRKIELDTPIHSTGLYNIVVKLHPEVIANLKVKVIGKLS